MKLNIKKIYPVIIVIAGIVFITACKEDTTEKDAREQEQRFFDLYVGANYPDANPRPNGLYFVEHKAGTGAYPDSTDWLLVNHVCYTIPEDIIYESYIENVVRDNRILDPDTLALYGPYKMENGSRTAGLTEGLTLMREGGEATIFFTSDLGFGAEGMAPITPFQSLKYEVELLEVIKDMDAYEQAKIDAYMDTIPVSDTIHDPETDAIMHYIIDEATDGQQVANDSLVTVAYKGYLIDGRVFDESADDAPYEFKVGDLDASTSPIKGWHLGLTRFKNGEKGRLVISYPLAYGEVEKRAQTGVRTIPPYETLVFDIEVISLKADPDDVDN